MGKLHGVVLQPQFRAGALPIMVKPSTLVSFMAAAGVALFGATAAQAQVIKIDGSSTVYPLPKQLLKISRSQRTPSR
jgi:ABC-type phosphate transport system substrate-binding protein